MTRYLFPLFVLCFSGLTAEAENWPNWRGPTGQGHTTETNLPLKWSPTENVKWKVPFADAGNSSPVVWGDKIFLTQANKGGTKRALMCLSRADGKTLWTKEIEYTEKETAWTPTYYCSASPAVDGERVVVSHASAGLYCYDFAGKELWTKNLGKFEHQYGNGTSPIIYENTVIMWAGPDSKEKNNYLIALDKKTGEKIWQTNEPKGSWGTPVIAKIDDKDQLLLGMTGKLKGYDPKDGKELWYCEGLSELVYTSVLYSNGVAVSMSGYTGPALAVKVGGSGNITKDRLWLHPKNTQRVGSGAIVGEHIYILEENGTGHCFELKTGKELWQTEGETKKRSWGSMVVSEDRLYVLTQNADTLVFAAKPSYELLATNKLGNEGANASIAVSDGELFIRTFKNLYCISVKK